MFATNSFAYLLLNQISIRTFLSLSLSPLSVFCPQTDREQIRNDWSSLQAIWLKIIYINSAFSQHITNEYRQTFRAYDNTCFMSFIITIVLQTNQANNNEYKNTNNSNNNNDNNNTIYVIVNLFARMCICMCCDHAYELHIARMYRQTNKKTTWLISLFEFNWDLYINVNVYKYIILYTYIAQTHQNIWHSSMFVLYLCLYWIKWGRFYFVIFAITCKQMLDLCYCILLMYSRKKS